jgi:hypothetical protein
MARNQLSASLLRPVLALLAVAGLLALSACGGGSGAPNNPFAPVPPTPGPVSLLPPSATVYVSTPQTLTVSGGQPPYSAFSSNPAILPVAQSVNGATVVLLANNVAASTTAVITVQDAIGQTATSTITVSPAPILNTLTITPARTTCGTNTVCSGDTATAAVQVLGPGGGGIPGRAVKFDVITGAYVLLTNNPSQPQAATLTVVSDNNGNAQVILQASVNAPTQPAVLRATDVTTGNTVTGSFTIVQVTDGSAILSVVPATATITGADTTQCSAGFHVDYYIYGGTPPYHVAATIPQAANVVNSTVAVSGGFFEVITTGVCANPVVFTIVDSVGRQTTANLVNQPGTTPPPTPPTPPATPALVATPAAQPTSGTLACTGKTLQFLVTGGTAPYSVAGVVVTPSQTTAPAATVSGQTVSVTGITGPVFPSTTSVIVVDQSSPQKTVTATITCSS